MKLCNSAFLLSFVFVGAYLVTPPRAAAPGSDVDCSKWVQQSYSLTCEIIEEFYGLVAAEFETWVNFVPESTLNPAPPASSVTSSSSISSTLVTIKTPISSSSHSSRSSTASPTPKSTKATSTTTTGDGMSVGFSSGPIQGENDGLEVV